MIFTESDRNVMRWAVESMDLCDDHDVPLAWYDDGDVESGPGEPFLECPKCRDEHMHPVMECYICNTMQRTVRMSTVNERFDPTTAYHLACGHVII